MRVADTSAVIAAFASWHDRHEQAIRVVPGNPLIAHCALETFSVLTRLPAPHRVSPDTVAEYLELQFPDEWLTLPAAAWTGLVRSLPGHGIAGGAAYDALIAATALSHGAVLVSCDRRAQETYRRIGVEVGLI